MTVLGTEISDPRCSQSAKLAARGVPVDDLGARELLVAGCGKHEFLSFWGSSLQAIAEEGVAARL